jgi:UDP-N-acetylmuramyl pentapeptide phosphotransferase/UDP-N-acetylglucosamine-1-phosphate transferase
VGDIWLIMFVVLIPVGFVIWSSGKTRVYWLICLAGMFAVLGGCEAYVRFVDVDHKTLSQRFYALPDLEAWLITGCLALGWLGLLLHLNWRRIVKLFQKKDDA